MNKSTRGHQAAKLRRMALAPAVLGVIAVYFGLSTVGKQEFYLVSFVICLLGLIVGWYTIQSRQWWWLTIPVAIALVWNPIFPFALTAEVWLILHYLATLGFATAGFVIRVPAQDQTQEIRR